MAALDTTRRGPKPLPMHPGSASSSPSWLLPGRPCHHADVKGWGCQRLLLPLPAVACGGRLACGPFPSFTHAQGRSSFFLSFWGCCNGMAAAPRDAAAAAATANGWHQRLVPLTEMWESAATLPCGEIAERLLPLSLPCRESADRALQVPCKGTQSVCCLCPARITYTTALQRSTKRPLSLPLP